MQRSRASSDVGPSRIFLRAVASYLPAKSAKGRAFHRWLIEVEVECLGYGATDPHARQDIAYAVLRMNRARRRVAGRSARRVARSRESKRRPAACLGLTTLTGVCA
jgi:hypothetical protein